MRETVTEQSLNSRGRFHGVFALLGDWRQCREDEHGKHAGCTKVVTCERISKLAIRSRPCKAYWLSLSWNQKLELVGIACITMDVCTRMRRR
jgi:hypothetical protein